jgi:N-acetylglucosamine kinase-like BadF-type ATPase
MNSNIIIIESGATKSDWRVMSQDGQEVKRFLRAGTNVSSMKMDDIKATLAEAITTEDLYDAQGLYLYTAGVVTPEISNELTTHIKALSGIHDVDIQNDLMGAARGVCGHDPGIVAILGTGSNACFFDGKDISQKVYSGGFILGDEGSGAHIGKEFLSDYLKGLVPLDIVEAFSQEFDASYAGIVQNVYRSASPSAYMGSLAPFLLKHAGNEYVNELIRRNFNSFITRFLVHYETDQYPVGIVGGFGWACQDFIRPLMEQSGIRISRFIKAPIDGLCQYHLEKHYD